MKLIATTLIGPGTIDMLREALESVAGLVDLCILIPTDPSITDSDVRREARLAKVPHDLVRFAWCDDFGAARQFAMDCARAAGADWQFMIDTDERLVQLLPDDEPGLRAQLEATTHAIAMMQSVEGTYSRERWFRIASDVRWIGRTHEYVSSLDRFELVGLRIRELPKSTEQFQAKLERDRKLLELSIADQPKMGRWHFYLGQTLGGLEKLPEAIAHYRECAALPGWDEERAWACYRAADLLCRLKSYREAIGECAKGLAIHPAFSELAWLAGWCCYQLAEYMNAICWEHMAASTGKWSGCGNYVKRVGFRHPPALFEGPFDVMAHSYRMLGHERAAHVCARKVMHATDFRLGRVPQPPAPEDADPPPFEAQVFDLPLAVVPALVAQIPVTPSGIAPDDPNPGV